MKIFLLIFISYTSIFNFYCSKCNNCCEKCCTHGNKIIKKSHDTRNKGNNKHKDDEPKDEHNDNNIVHYKDFNKDFKFTFLKNALFQHNNNCTLNAVFMSLFNFPQIQNLLLYNDFDHELLKCAKKLLKKAIDENDKSEAINYLDIYNNIFEYIKKNKPEIIGGGNLSDTITTDHFLGIFKNLGIICNNCILSFIDCKLTKTCLENKENIINLNKNKTNIVNFKESLKNINLVKYIFKELKYYDRLCKLIDNLNFNSENYHLFEPDNQAFMYNIDRNISLDRKYFIIVPENENIKDYISKLPNEDIYSFYDKILEDDKIELELISINFIDPIYHIFTINKNVKDNKWYMFDDLCNQNCIEVDFEQLLKDGFFIKKGKHSYRPDFFYFNAKFKNK